MEQFYTDVRNFHSLFRWLVLGLSALVVANFLLGSVSKKNYDRAENLLTLFYTIACDIQLLIGLLLYFVLSPVTKSLMEGNSSLSDSHTRFYAIEHPLIMLLAIVFAHVGRAVSKKAPTDAQKFRRGLLWFGLSLLFMLARMPWNTM